MTTRKPRRGLQLLAARVGYARRAAWREGVLADGGAVQMQAAALLGAVGKELRGSEGCLEEPAALVAVPASVARVVPDLALGADLHRRAEVASGVHRHNCGEALAVGRATGALTGPEAAELRRGKRIGDRARHRSWLPVQSVEVAAGDPATHRRWPQDLRRILASGPPAPPAGPPPLGASCGFPGEVLDSSVFERHILGLGVMRQASGDPHGPSTDPWTTAREVGTPAVAVGIPPLSSFVLVPSAPHFVTVGVAKYVVIEVQARAAGPGDEVEKPSSVLVQAPAAASNCKDGATTSLASPAAARSCTDGATTSLASPAAASNCKDGAPTSLASPAAARVCKDGATTSLASPAAARNCKDGAPTLANPAAARNCKDGATSSLASPAAARYCKDGTTTSLARKVEEVATRFGQLSDKLARIRADLEEPWVASAGARAAIAAAMRTTPTDGWRRQERFILARSRENSRPGQGAEKTPFAADSIPGPGAEKTPDPERDPHLLNLWRTGLP
jgi:hypothetical protein